MHKLGISVYPDKSPMEEVYTYMEKAAKLGYSRIFTCFLSIKVYLCSVRMIFNLIPIFAYVYTNCVKEI